MIQALKKVWFQWPVKFGYDATETSTRRKAPRSDVKAEDDHLNAAKRRKLVSTTRDLRRSYTLAAWMIRQHVNYVATHSFQGKNDNSDFNDNLERLVRWWSLPGNFDVAGRHSRARFTRLAEVSRVIDGDVYFYKLRAGLIQALEGDRIATPTGGFPAGTRYDIADFKHGIKTSKGGRNQAYILNNRNETGTRLDFNRVIPAKHVVPFGYYDRYDQVRGISPLAAAINTLQDTYEGITYALARAKVSQLFALALKRGSGLPAGNVTAPTDEGDDSEYKIDFGKGPIQLDLDPDDEATFLESKQPSEEFQNFIEIMIQLCLKALDIPYSFYNESFTNYSGARQALMLYEQSAKVKQGEVADLLDILTRWRLELWIIDGVISLPAGMTISDVNWEWQPSGIPWIDPLKERQADAVAVASAQTSRQRIAKRSGDDWWEILNELDEENKGLAERGVVSTAPVIREQA